MRVGFKVYIFSLMKNCCMFHVCSIKKFNLEKNCMSSDEYDSVLSHFACTVHLNVGCLGRKKTQCKLESVLHVSCPFTCIWPVLLEGEGEKNSSCGV